MLRKNLGVHRYNIVALKIVSPPASQYKIYRAMSLKVGLEICLSTSLRFIAQSLQPTRAKIKQLILGKKRAISIPNLNLAKSDRVNPYL